MSNKYIQCSLSQVKNPDEQKKLWRLYLGILFESRLGFTAKSQYIFKKNMQ